MFRFIRLKYAFAAAAVVACAFCDVASAQLPLRGRYVRRDGLFRVEKFHWGGGISTNAAGVLSTGITAFAPIVGSLVGRDAPPDDATKSDAGTRSMLSDEYLQELRKARELLARTAALVTSNVAPSTGGSTTTSGSSAEGSGGTPAAPEFGSESPWKTRPGSGANTAPVPPQPGITGP